MSIIGITLDDTAAILLPVTLRSCLNNNTVLFSAWGRNEMRTGFVFGIVITAVLAASGPARSQSTNNVRQCLSIANVDQRVGCLEAAAAERRRELPSPAPQMQSSDPIQPSITDTLAPFKTKMEKCFLDHVIRAQESQINPPDFSRIIEGACPVEVENIHQIGFRWWSTYLPRSTVDGRAASEKYVRTVRNQAVSIYTERWYATAKKNEPKSQPASSNASSGSGFLINRDGQILTNNHVVNGCSEILISTKAGAVLPARVVARTEADDLAVLQSEVTTIEPAKFRFAPAPRIGESVIVFGFPQLGLLASSGNVTNGIITGAVGLGDDARRLQISAPVQSGNSGGPLLDTKGNVIGVIVSKLGLRAAIILEDLPQNVGFAIKGAVVRSFLDTNEIKHSIREEGPDLSVADVAERAREFSVSILCKQTVSAGIPRPPERKVVPESGGVQPNPSLPQRTASFLNGVYSKLSGPNEIARKYLTDLYADSVNYYGKPLSRDQVVVQLNRFFERWPVRQYKPKDGSVNIECDEKSLVCTVKGTLDFDSRSPDRKERSAGVAAFEYTLSYSSPTAIPRITAESGSIIERHKEAL